MQRGRMFFGMLLLAVGGLLLLNNLGLLPADLDQLLWPSLLILFGLWVLVRNRFSKTAFNEQELVIPLAGAQSGRLKLRHGAGRIIIGPGASSEQLLTGTFVGGVTHKLQTIGDRAELELSVPSDNWLSFPWGSGRGFEWSLQLPADLPLELWLENGAGELNLDLRTLKVERLTLKTGASSSKVQLPADVERCQVKVEAGAASVVLEVPAESEASISAEIGLAELSLSGDRFARIGDRYQTSGYQQADRRVDIDISAGVSSVEIR